MPLVNSSYRCYDCVLASCDTSAIPFCLLCQERKTVEVRTFVAASMLGETIGIAHSGQFASGVRIVYVYITLQQVLIPQVPPIYIYV